MKYLVTGGTGFIGSALVHRLVKEGHQVRVLDNSLRGSVTRLEGLSKKVELIAADIRDPQVVQEACKGMESVCHLAYLNGTEYFYSKPELVLDIAVKGMINIIDGCIKEQVKEFILASSSEVYQTPPVVPTDESAPLSIPDVLNPRYSYGGGKVISELMAVNYGRQYFNRVVIFRPHNVYGPDMGTEHVIPQLTLRMKKICQKTDGTINFPIQGTGQETRAFIYIDDFIEGLMLVLNKGDHLGIYHIGTMEEIAIEKIVEEIAHYFQREIHIVPGPLREGGTLRRCPNIVKLRRLGFNPQISFEEGLNKTVAWYDQCAREFSKI